jgi:hypothetical protein
MLFLEIEKPFWNRFLESILEAIPKSNFRRTSVER